MPALCGFFRLRVGSGWALPRPNSLQEETINHWHQCAVCLEYFACICDDSIKLSAICEDCELGRKSRIISDPSLRDVLKALASCN